MNAYVSFPSPKVIERLIKKTAVSDSPTTLSVAIPTNTCDIIELVALLQTSIVNGAANLTGTFNSDGGTNYDLYYETAVATTISVGKNLASPSFETFCPSGSDSNANFATPIRVKIFGNKSGKYKYFECEQINFATNGASYSRRTTRGFYKSTAEITTIELTSGSVVLVAPSQYELFGYK